MASIILIAGIGNFAITFGKITLKTVACALILGILANAMLSKKSKKAASEEAAKENSEPENKD